MLYYYALASDELFLIDVFSVD